MASEVDMIRVLESAKMALEEIEQDLLTGDKYVLAATCAGDCVQSALQREMEYCDSAKIPLESLRYIIVQ